MKPINFCLIVLALSFSPVPSANEIGVGGDKDIPGSQPPPAETETATTESLLQQLIELFRLDAE